LFGAITSVGRFTRSTTRRCEGLAAARDTEQRLVLLAGLDSLDQLGDGARLIALRRVLGNQLEAVRHEERI
jgi:hypothetical protein